MDALANRVPVETTQDGYDSRSNHPVSSVGLFAGKTPVKNERNRKPLLVVHRLLLEYLLDECRWRVSTVRFREIESPYAAREAFFRCNDFSCLRQFGSAMSGEKPDR